MSKTFNVSNEIECSDLPLSLPQNYNVACIVHIPTYTCINPLSSELFVHIEIIHLTAMAASVKRELSKCTCSKNHFRTEHKYEVILSCNRMHAKPATVSVLHLIKFSIFNTY